MADGPVVAKAWVSVIPEMSGAQAKVSEGLGEAAAPAGAKAGEKSGKSFASSMSKTLATTGAAMTASVTAPLTSFGKQCFQTATDFQNAMSQVQGALGGVGVDVEGLESLAKQLGSTTIFSAKDAASAMVELAKGGLTEADIQGGALAATMDLAAAGQLDLAEAANTTVRAMGGFGLGAQDTARIANALAGAANASSSDVGDLSYALAQCSASANNAGWSIEDTTAMLGLFADAGIVGSDAGTSLKTMLQRLQAPTDTAALMMQSLGISAYDEAGHMKGAAEVAEMLQSQLGGLDEAARNAALATIFGSDASRAATVLMNEGAAGLAGYTEATYDSEAASRMAAAQYGEAGWALLEMEAATEGAKIAIGEALAPVITRVMGVVTELATAFTNLDPGIQTAIVAGVALVAVLGPLAIGLGAVVGAVATVAPVIAGAGAALAGLVSPAGIVIAVLVAVLATSEQFRDGVAAAFDAAVGAVIGALSELWEAVKGIFDGVVTAVGGALEVLTGIVDAAVGFVVGLVTGDFSYMAAAVANIFNGVSDMVRGVWNGLVSFFGGVVNTIVSLFSGPLNAVTSITAGIFGGAADVIGSLMGNAKNKVSDGLNAIAGFFRGLHLQLPHIALPHFSISGGFSLNPLQVPHLSISWYAKGGVFEKASVIGVGEDGPEAVVPLAGRRMEPFADAVADRIGDRGGVTVCVEQLVVREEADIDRIAEKLYQKTRRKGLVRV